MKPSLIDEYESFTEAGTEVSDAFYNLIKDFVTQSCLNYDSTQVEYILQSSIQTICTFCRVKNGLKLRCNKEDRKE